MNATADQLKAALVFKYNGQWNANRGATLRSEK